jgi:hypothetical protein
MPPDAQVLVETVQTCSPRFTALVELEPCELIKSGAWYHVLEVAGPVNVTLVVPLAQFTVPGLLMDQGVGREPLDTVGEYDVDTLATISDSLRSYLQIKLPLQLKKNKLVDLFSRLALKLFQPSCMSNLKSAQLFALGFELLKLISKV